MYKAVFIDMDGTLLRKDHTVSDVNKKAIQQLLDRGVLVVPISARPLHGILPITNKVVPGSMPVVSLNGSYIYHNRDIVFQASIDLQDVVTIHRELQQYDVSAMYYSQLEWFTTMDSKLVRKEQKITEVNIVIQPFEQTLASWESRRSGPNKILIAGEPHLIIEIEKKFLELHGDKLNIYKSQPRYLELMSLQASKAKAIQFLINQYGILPEEIIAIGDNYNDQGMIEFAGVGVAMGNAPDAVKMAANYVTDTNNNDGVAKALDYFFQQGEVSLQ